MSEVIGIDPSLTSTGLAHGSRPLLTTLKPPKSLDGVERLVWIRDAILHTIEDSTVVIEGYAYGAKHQAHQIGELGGVLRVALYENGIRTYVVPPTKLKMFAAGKGNASKDVVGYEAVSRFGISPGDNNQADALWLWEIGNHLLGTPTIDLPKTHTRALDGKITLLHS